MQPLGQDPRGPLGTPLCGSPPISHQLVLATPPGRLQASVRVSDDSTSVSLCQLRRGLNTMKQEAQLMLTNLRDAYRSVKVT